MKINLILDSGAFSAWTMKKEIGLEEYCDFALSNQQYIQKVVNLDVIGPGDPETAAEAGRVNFLRMRDRGIESMPVVHARESFKWLDLMIDDCPWIGLSGTSLVSPVENRTWHNLVWDFVTDKKGYAHADFHAFGDTSPQRLLTYPFYSADSATWMIQAGRAACIKLNGRSYQLLSKKIRGTAFISSEDSGPKRLSWEEEIRDLGLEPELVINAKGSGSELAMIRSYLVASDLLRLQEKTRPVTRFRKPRSLIENSQQQRVGREREGPVKLYFVISPSAFVFNFPIIAALGIENILVSYYYVKEAPEEWWNEMMLPFLYNPVEMCQSTPKVKRFWDKLQECLVKEKVSV